MENGMFTMAAALTVFLLIFCFVGLCIVHYKTTKEKKLEKKKNPDIK